MKINSGNDMQARIMGGDFEGDSGTSTAIGATSITDSGKSWTTNVYSGHRVFTGAAWGLIISNTGTVLTIDRWYIPGNSGGAAQSTPSTGTYIIASGGPPAWFMGLTANSSAAVNTDTSLTGEITTASGGLIRKICPYGHTAGVASYTLTPIFTANGSDTLPVTVAKIGVFNSMVVSDTTSTMLFETLLSATATFAASGDAMTVTESVSL